MFDPEFQDKPDVFNEAWLTELLFDIADWWCEQVGAVFSELMAAPAELRVPVRFDRGPELSVCVSETDLWSPSLVGDSARVVAPFAVLARFVQVRRVPSVAFAGPAGLVLALNELRSGQATITSAVELAALVEASS